MTRRTTAPLLLAGVAALTLAACSHQAGSGAATTHRSPATAGLAADSTEPSPDTANDTDTGTQQNGGTGTGTGGGGGIRTTRPSPSPSASAATGPRIVSFTATGAVCPAHGPNYDHPGEVTISWKIANADGVSLAIDGGLYSSYNGMQGSDTISFQCPLAGKTNTHRYTLTIKNTHVTKTVSASATAEPA